MDVKKEADQILSLFSVLIKDGDMGGFGGSLKD